MNRSHERLLRHLSLGMLVLALGMLSSCNLGSEKFSRGDISDLNDAILVQEERGGRYSLMGLDGEIIIKDVVSSSDGFTGCYNGIFGVKDPSGGYTLYKLGKKPQKLTDAVYESVGFAAEGVIPVQQKDGAPLVLSTKDGKPLFEVKEYKGISVSSIGGSFYGGINYYAVVNQMPGAYLLYGFINTKGEFLTEPIYEMVSHTTSTDKVYGLLPSADGETVKVEVLNNKGKALFSTTTRITEEGWNIVLGKDRCVIGDKIFNLKGEAVGHLPAESVVWCIGPRDYILAYGDDAWYLLDEDGEEVTIIRNAVVVLFDTTGKNYVVVENLNRSGEDVVFTAYTIKGNKSVYEVSGSLYFPLKDGKFLLRQSSDYVMYDAKGKEICGKYFSDVIASQAPYGIPVESLIPMYNTR
ncbi:WG repeat-containing protein [uncultured Porphyromonas sp.]|uniref:WG repeat-containing protein n=1 Tax=uncultured Porphyromonas sp. TaxID=159274 RepID=UPI002612119F|nr:WG repeat-containing protein [uncultured Porphyromonas sp.]